MSKRRAKKDNFETLGNAAVCNGGSPTNGLQKEKLDGGLVRISHAAEIALQSTCLRSRCGSVIYSAQGQFIGAGYNSPPLDIPPDTCRKNLLPQDFKSDRTCCIHAEQRAIMDALRTAPDELKGATLYFIRLDPLGNWSYAGDPYCTICSKLALDVGIAFFVLYRWEGAVSYPTNEYNELSFAFGQS